MAELEGRMNEDTQEVPLPEGVERNPDATVTQELPVVEPFPEIRLVTPVRVVLPSQAETVRVETLPPHLLGDPILTAPAPVADKTPLYDQIHGTPERRKPAPPRRRMPVGDKVLIGMGAAALVMGAGVYGMVVEGWGAGDTPEKSASAPQKPVPVTSEPEEPEATTSAPRAARIPEKAPVKAVAAPETYTPTPEQSIVVVSPTPTEEETAEEPEPTISETSRPSPPPAPTPTETEPTPTETPTSASPTPTDTETPVFPPSLSASSTPEGDA